MNCYGTEGEAVGVGVARVIVTVSMTPRRDRWTFE
jgi:hypothetical protein